MSLKCSDLAMHDWLNLEPAEQEQALRDVRALAESTMVTDHRRGRALHIMASYFAFVSERR